VPPPLAPVEVAIGATGCAGGAVGVIGVDGLGVVVPPATGAGPMGDAGGVPAGIGAMVISGGVGGAVSLPVPSPEPQAASHSTAAPSSKMLLLAHALVMIDSFPMTVFLKRRVGGATMSEWPTPPACIHAPKPLLATSSLVIQAVAPSYVIATIDFDRISDSYWKCRVRTHGQGSCHIAVRQ